MKKVVKIVQKGLEKTLVLNPNNVVYENDEYFSDAILKYISSSTLYKLIKIDKIKSLSQQLLQLLTPHYLRGTEVVINERSFKLHNAKPYYGYEWVPFNRSKLVKSLAEYPVEGSTFLQLLQKAPLNYLPPVLWEALDKYSQSRIAKVNEYNYSSMDYSYAEEFYKQLMYNFPNMYIVSPNPKTLYEVKAELEFEKECAKYRNCTNPLTELEKAFLKKNAPFYDIEVPNFMWRYGYRETAKGYTKEPQVVYGVSEEEIARGYYDPRNTNNLPRDVRNGFQVQVEENDTLLREAYDHLMYIMSLGDEYLATGYVRCPVCGDIVHEQAGCQTEDGHYHLEPIHMVKADNLLYGIASTYSDMEDEQDYYNENLTDEEDAEDYVM